MLTRRSIFHLTQTFPRHQRPLVSGIMEIIEMLASVSAPRLAEP